MGGYVSDLREGVDTFNPGGQRVQSHFSTAQTRFSRSHTAPILRRSEHYRHRVLPHVIRKGKASSGEPTNKARGGEGGGGVGGGITAAVEGTACLLALSLLTPFQGRRYSDPTLNGLPSNERRLLLLSMFQTLARLHSIDWKAAGLEGYGSSRGDYCSRQVCYKLLLLNARTYNMG